MGQHVFMLTDEQCRLIADALDIVNPDDTEVEEQARALSIQFRTATAEADAGN